MVKKVHVQDQEAIPPVRCVLESRRCVLGTRTVLEVEGVLAGGGGEVTQGVGLGDCGGAGVDFRFGCVGVVWARGVLVIASTFMNTAVCTKMNLEEGYLAEI
jgi:hypothetical protein